MDALLMCGGRGERLTGVETEKPLVPVCGTPMVDRVADALANAARVGTTYAVVSPNAPDTASRVRERGIPVVETPGDGYVSDLERALDDDRVARPVLTVVADLPLLDGATIGAVVDDWEDRNDRIDDADRGSDPTASTVSGRSLTVCVPAALKRALGVSLDATFDPDTVGCATVAECASRDLAPTGLNVVAGPTDDIEVYESERLAVNVNRPADRRVAEERCD